MSGFMRLILGKVKAGVKFSEIKKKINHLTFMDDLIEYSKNKKELEFSRQLVELFTERIV